MKLVKKSFPISFLQKRFYSLDLLLKDKSSNKTTTKTLLKKHFSIYVHWPFCSSICHYCDFNRYKRDLMEIQNINQTEDALGSKMLNSYEKILDTFLQQEQQQDNNFLSKDTHTLSSIFFGGGTPSTANPKVFEKIVSKALHYFPNDNNNHTTFTNSNTNFTTNFNEKNRGNGGQLGRVVGDEGEIEISMEANPTSMEISKLRDFKSVGINRLSIGIQSLTEESLNFLGRKHSSIEALKAIELAKQLFNKVSIDLIFGIPLHKKNPKVWLNDLERALGLGLDHISLYQLTIEKNTKLHRMLNGGEFAMPDEEEMAYLYESTIKMCEEYGLKLYEVSNFAREGHECKHNVLYWKGIDDFIGIGPGAHGRITNRKTNQRYATIQTLKPEDWIEQVNDDFNNKKILLGNRKEEELDEKQRIEELFMMGLRLVNEGISEESLKTINNKLTLENVLSNAGNNVIRQLEENNYIIYDREKKILKATLKGITVLDELIPTLLY